MSNQTYLLQSIKAVSPHSVHGSYKNDVCFQLEFGVVYSCLEDKMYKARKGKGAFCNDEKIEVSDVTGNIFLLCQLKVWTCYFEY